MITTFHSTLPNLQDTMLFEAEYEPELKEDFDTKSKLIHYGLPCWLRVDGELVGELLGASPIWLTNVIPEPIPDTSAYDDHSYYCYTTTILPAHRGRGYAKLLKVYMLGQLFARGYFKMIGHATNAKMKQLNLELGAVFDPTKVHQNWYDSGRTAEYYEIPLLERVYA